MRKPPKVVTIPSGILTKNVAAITTPSMKLCTLSPAMIRGIWRDAKKYEEKYWTLNGRKTRFYITGDSAIVYPDGNIRILGRSDDVIKVAGHRLSTAELEDVVHGHHLVGEVAVVSAPDEIKG